MASRSEVVWRSARCEDGACVEVATIDGAVLIRDSKHREGPVLTFTFAEWEAFLGAAREGTFNLP